MHRDFWIAVVALVALALVVFWGKSYETTLRGIDSNIHAAASMSVTSGGGLPSLPIPYLAGDPAQPVFNDQPFFMFWLNGMVMRALGPAAWSARLVSAFFSVGCVLLTLLLGSLFVSRAYGICAALLFLFCKDVILTGATFTLDMPMLFFILLTFILWEKKHWHWMGVVAGVGLWVKTPVVLLVFPTAFLVCFFQKREKREFQKLFLAAAIAIGVGSLVWIATGVLGGWGLVVDYWTRQVWGTAVEGRNAPMERDWFLFFSMVMRGFLPGLPLLIFGLVRIIYFKLWKEPVVQVSFVAISVVVGVVTLLRFKYPYYYNPTFPFLALIAAFSIKDWIEKYQKWVYATLSAVTPILLAVLLCAPVSFGEEPFVSLKRFEAIIQSHGNCSLPVLIVPGGEPLGSHLDYRVHLAFYTGRKPIYTACESLDLRIEETARKGQIGWVILSQENLDRCLKDSNRKRFKQIYRVGSQYLLTDLAQKDNTVNLTPLEREGRAVRDCNAAPYPRDRYHAYLPEDI